MLTIDVKKKYFFGTNKEGKSIYFTKPSFECGWYWSFGHLGNINCHYHLSSYANGRNINMYNALKADYDLNPKILENLWLFCELSQTIYNLKETAEVLHRGGSNYSNNPFKELIKNEDEVKRINEIVLPKLLQAVINIF